MDYFHIQIDEEDIKREKSKAQKLRQSGWWKNKRGRGICHYCGKNFPPKELTMDHLVPIARGGKSTKGNIVPSCKECNNKKKYLLPTEWEEYLTRLKDDGII